MTSLMRIDGEEPSCAVPDLIGRKAGSETSKAVVLRAKPSSRAQDRDSSLAGLFGDFELFELLHDVFPGGLGPDLRVERQDLAVAADVEGLPRCQRMLG